MMITPNMVSSAPATNPSDSNNGVSDLFLQLLTTQLKAQSPADPVDPTAFVGQLIQFNSLDQLTQIRQLLAAKTSSQAAPVATNQNQDVSHYVR